MSASAAEPAAEKPPSRVLGRVLWVVKVGVAGALVWWLWRSGRIDVAALRAVRPSADLGLSLAWLLVVFALPVVRWIRLLRARGVRLGAWVATVTGLRGAFATLFLPGTGGQDTIRFLVARDRGAPSDILASLVVDRLIGLVGMLGLAAGGALVVWWTTPTPGIRGFAAVIFSGFAVVSGATVIVLAYRPPWLRRLVAKVGPVDRMFQALEAYRGLGGALREALVWSLAVQFLYGVTMYYGARALGSPLRLVEAVVVAPVVGLAQSLPLTPLGLGVADLVGDEAFRRLGAGSGASLTLLLRAATVLVCVLGAVGFALPIPEDEQRAKERSAGGGPESSE